MVDVKLLLHLTGVAISCSLAMTLARFYKRSMYDSFQEKTTKLGKRVRLLHAAIRNLKFSKDLMVHPPQHPISTPSPTLAMHSDTSASIGLGVMLGSDL